MPNQNAEPEPEPGDAFGCALLDRLAGVTKPIVIERNDGFITVDDADYAAGWDELDQWALDRATGRVLDVGAGMGRASLALQRRGQPVLALDISPGAVRVCRERGVREVFSGSVQQAAAAGMAGWFDTALLLGNCLSLLGSPESAGSFLTALGTLLAADGRAVGTCLDPHQTDSQTHLDFHERNRHDGKMAGQAAIRVRYQGLASGWFDWLLMSPDELAQVTAPHGWRVAETMPGVRYAAVLTRH
jgi:SAM-dependent methyltransferase